MKVCFVDTWAWVAMTNRRDAGHEVAVQVDRWLAAHHWVLATSDWVLDETLTQLQALGGSRVSLAFLDALETQVQARSLMMLHSSPLRLDATLRWFKRVAPTIDRISLTDCSSFALMEELSIRWAFTADRHFYRAGPNIGPLVTRDADELLFRAPVA